MGKKPMIEHRCPVCNGMTRPRTLKEDQALLDELLSHPVNHETWCLLWSLQDRIKAEWPFSTVERIWVRARLHEMEELRAEKKRSEEK